MTVGAMRDDFFPRRVIDDRTDVGRELPRIADAQFVHRAVQHGQHLVGDIVLQIEQAQRRAALPGALESGREHVADHLFGQRGGIDQHRVEAAGFGNQRRVRRHGSGHAGMDFLRGGGRTGKADAGQTGIGTQAGAYLAAARQQLQRGFGNTGFVHQAHRELRDQAGLLGRFGNDAVTRRERGKYLSAEDCQRKVPW